MQAAQQQPQTSIRFAYGLDCHGIWTIDCYLDGQLIELLVGSNTCEHIRNSHSLTPELFERDVVGRLGTVSFHNGNAPSTGLVAELNRWRRLTSPEGAELPPIVVPAFYVEDIGWVKTQSVEDAQQMAGL
jgi:hypothetical protein